MAISTSPDRLPDAAEILEPSPAALMRRRAFRHYGLIIGGGFLALIVFVALAAPFIAPHDPYDQELTRRLIPPIWHHKGTWEYPQVSLLIGFTVMLISGVIGTAMGIAAGYFGGRFDMIITFIITTRLAMPAILVALAVVALVGSSTTVVIWVLGLLLWDRFAVVMRSTTQQIRNLDYVAAAEAAGCSTLRILVTEIMPNVFNALIVVATLEIAHAVLLEAALSFLGLGVQPPTPSWGLMISEGKGHMFFKPWLIAIPGFALFVMILCINMLGDGIRDVTAPENRN